jgi:D-lactate dehydrogenase
MLLPVMALNLLYFVALAFNNVTLDAAKRNNICVMRVPAYSPHAVAEHAVALMLTLARKDA